MGIDFRASRGGISRPWDPAAVASDLYLYVLYNRTIGRRVLHVSGDETGDALVYAHCAKTGSGNHNNGSVTLMVANPSSVAISLSLSSPALPRLQYLTPRNK